MIVIQSLFQVFDTSFYRALYAKGQIRENALISPTLGFIQFPVVYLFFKLGCSPVALSWAALVTNVLLGMVIKPILVIRIVNYTWRDVFSVFIPCLKVTLVSLPVPLLADYYLDTLQLPMIADFIIIVTICIVSVTSASWFIGLTPDMRVKLIGIVKKKVNRT